jgi:MFS family permease
MNKRAARIVRDLQYYKFCSYGFLKNLRLYEPFLVLFFLDNGLSYLQLGFLYTLREVTRNVLEIPAGILSDSLGRRRTMIFSFTLYIASFAVFYFGYSYSLFMIGMFAYAVGDAFRTGTHKAMIFDYLAIKGWTDQKANYYGHTRSYSQLGSAVSSLVGGAMVFYSGNFRDIFLYTSVPYMLDLLLISSYPASLDGVKKGLKGKHIRENFKQVTGDFIRSFRNRKMVRAIANLSIHTGYYRSFKDYLQPVLQSLALSIPVLLFLDDHKRTAVLIGIVYFFIYLLTSFSSRESGRFSARFQSLTKPLNLTLLAGVIAGILCGFFIHIGIMLAAVALYILIFMVENLRKPLGISRVAEAGNEEILATTLSAESQFHSLVVALLAPFIGFVADLAGLGVSIAAVSMLILLLFPLLRLPPSKNYS